MKILAAHRNYLIINQGVISTIFNFFLNLGIAWYLYHAMERIPLWGPLSIGIDTLATAFVLPWLSCYFIAISTWFALKKRWLPVIADYPLRGPVGLFIQQPVITQGVLFGVMGTLCLAVPVITWFMITGTNTLSLYAFLWFKSLFAAVLSLAVSPLIGLCAFFGSAPRKKPH